MTVVATIEFPVEQSARQFGVIETDKDWRIQGFEEKPEHPKESPHRAGILQRVDGDLHF